MKLGCEALVDNPPAWFGSKRLGLLANQASVTRSFEHVSPAVTRAGGKLACLFSPQHGFYMEKQANMIESCDGWEPNLNIPV
ncbi:MAG: exo-beta-N-acetylmuramidase NamZ domain-containing protein, partial [Syntrophobacteraceae bacterium]